MKSNVKKVNSTYFPMVKFTKVNSMGMLKMVMDNCIMGTQYSMALTDRTFLWGKASLYFNLTNTSKRLLKMVILMAKQPKSQHTPIFMASSKMAKNLKESSPLISLDMKDLSKIINFKAMVSFNSKMGIVIKEIFKMVVIMVMESMKVEIKEYTKDSFLTANSMAKGYLNGKMEVIMKASIETD